MGLPWWLTGSIPDPGRSDMPQKTLHPTSHLSPCTTTVEPVIYSVGTATWLQTCGLQQEKPPK